MAAYPASDGMDSLQELQSLPRVSRRSLSLTRASSEASVLPNTRVTSSQRASSSRAALFASARALGERRAGDSTGSRTGAAANECSSSVKPPQVPTPARQSGYGGLVEGAKAAPVAPVSTIGISAAFMYTFIGKHVPEPEEGTPGQTTRQTARALKRRMQEAEQTGPYTDCLNGQRHSVSGGKLSGKAGTYVAHAWDADMCEMVDTLVADAQGDLDKRYLVDVFGADLHSGLEDPVADVQRRVAVADSFILLVNGEGQALRRLWVVFESLLALQAGKLQVRCTAPGGFGGDEAALTAWEARIDAADWVLAEATLKSDEKHLRAFAAREWETAGKGVERILAQFRKALRQDIYSQIMMTAVKKGDKKAVLAALDLGADPEAKDSMGNAGEALAAFEGRTDIADLLFERRMKNQFHAPLSQWALDPQLLASSGQANWFVTEFLDGNLETSETRDDDEDMHIAGVLMGLSEQSTCTPNLSSRAESHNASHSPR